MKPAVFVLCLLAGDIAAARQSVATHDVRDQRAAVDEAYRIREVRFTGDAAFERARLEQVLSALKIRTPIPGVWTRHPVYNPDAIEADLVRLRSFYVSQGYFDARVGVGEVTFDGREATVTIDVQSGPKRRVRHVRIDGLGSEDARTVAGSNGEFPVDALCRCFLEAQRIAESHGRLDFAVRLDISEADSPPAAAPEDEVDVTAQVAMGSAFAVGRITFSGHRTINDSTLRRIIGLQERDLFDVSQLRRSLARLNQMGRFEPLRPGAVEIRTDPRRLTADLAIALRERPRGQWTISGPVAPLAGTLQLTLSSRLPAWGRGVFEASTYYVTFNLIAPWSPLLRLLPIAPKRSPWSWIAIERPWLPGRWPLSGFSLSPMFSTRTMLARYGRAQVSRVAREVFEDDGLDAGLLIPVSTPTAVPAGGDDQARFLLCDPPEPGLRWLRRGAARVADLALGVLLP
jgi:outer membrane protein insertion porin family